MAQCKQSAIDFLQDAFAPLIAVHCSQDAEVICQKNNLTFVQLIQPFCRLTQEAHIRDPGNVSQPVRNLRVNMREINASIPNPTLARKMMNDIVASTQPTVSESNRNNVITVGDYDLQISPQTPWFEAYRDCFLQLTYPSDHEFTKHYLGCIFVVSTGHSEPLEQFQKLIQIQHQNQHQSGGKTRWFCPNVLRYYVLLHDVTSGDQSSAEQLYQSMKSTYGVNQCHLLQINSRNAADMLSVNGMSDQPQMPDPWGQFIPKTSPKEESNPVLSPTTPRHGQHVDELTTGNSILSPTLPTSPDEKPTLLQLAESQTNADEAIVKSAETIDHPLAPCDDTLPTQTSLENVVETKSLDNDVTGVPPGEKSQVTHGAWLTMSDHDRLRVFVHEFMVRGLIPWAERMLRTLHEQVTSRRGIHKTLFSATKKWFGGNKPGVPPAATERANVVYTSEAPEMQMRRLADLAFMFQLYDIAYQTYHTAKRDFNHDHAWLYLAGTLEMACLSVFMQGPTSPRQYPNHYIESAVNYYLSTCKLPQFATRATLLSTEALKSKGLYSEAALQFIKMTSEDSDLRSALLLEQASHCYINMSHPMVRKYAFHMILAGHRYSKAGQRQHALRSYAQALQVYKSKNWNLAEDHINFTMGRQSFNLKQLDNAVSSFKHLLTKESLQTAAQQSAFLREYLFVYKQHLSSMTSDGMDSKVQPTLSQLPLPVIDGNKTRVLVSTPSTKGDAVPAMASVFDMADRHLDLWQKLEEMILMKVKGSTPINFQPSLQCFTARTKNTASPRVVLKESLVVELEMCNPLHIPLPLSEIRLLWKFLPSSTLSSESSSLPGDNAVTNETSSKESEKIVETQVIDKLVLNEGQCRKVQLSLTPQHTGELHIVGVAYSIGATVNCLTTDSNENQQPNPDELSSNKPQRPTSFLDGLRVTGCQSLEVQGPRLNSTKIEKTSKMYGPDRRLDLVVVPPMPLLQVNIGDIPDQMLAGEIHKTCLYLKNSGQKPLGNLYVASTNSKFFTFGENTHNCWNDNSNLFDLEVISGDLKNNVISEAAVTHVQRVPINCETVGPGDSLQVPMYIHAPATAGEHQVHFLFYYEGSQEESKSSQTSAMHRVARLSVSLQVSSSLGIKSVATRSSSFAGSDQLNQFIVTLETENMNQVPEGEVSELDLLQVTCASCKWHFQHINPSHTDFRISPSENSMFVFKASALDQASHDSANVMSLSNVPFTNSMIHSAFSPCSDFYRRSRQSLNFEDIDLSPPNPNQQPITEEKSQAMHYAQFRDLKNTTKVEMTLILLWKAVILSKQGIARTASGQHHLHLDDLDTPVCWPPYNKMQLEQEPVKIITGPSNDSSMLPSSAVLSQLVKYSLQFKQPVYHNFNKSSLCTVKLTLKLHNCSEAELELMMELISYQDNSVSSAPGSHSTYDHLVVNRSSQKFHWSGRKKTFLSLGAGMQTSLALQASFTQAGLYDLGGLQISARPFKRQGVIDWTMQKPTSTSAILVKDSKSAIS